MRYQPAANAQLEFKLRDALRESADASREAKAARASLKTAQLSKLRQPVGRRRQQPPIDAVLLR